MDTEYRERGGLGAPQRTAPPRTVHLLQRKASKVGKGLGKTTGWIHRLELRHRGVEMVAGADYRRIDDEQGVFWPCPDDEHPGTPRLFADRFATPDGQEVAVSLQANPSHLEAVNPVLEGVVRAKQDMINKG